MKIKSGFMLREIAGQWVIVPLGARVVEFNGIMTLSESGALLWKRLEQGASEDELVSAIRAEYDVDEELARRDVSRFTQKIINKNLCE